jgi:hypothetical protein
MKRKALSLTQDKLKTLIHYDPTTGELRKRSNDMVYRSLDSSGYVRVSLGEYGAFNAQTLIWLYMTGKWATTPIRRKNGIRTDNRLDNLYVPTANIIFWGIQTKRGSYYAKIEHDGVFKDLGPFGSREDADLARNAYRDSQ